MSQYSGVERRSETDFRQEIHMVAMQMAEQQRFSTEMLKGIHDASASVSDLTTKVEVLVAVLSERCPQHKKDMDVVESSLQKEIEALKSSIADIKKDIEKHSERIKSIENDKYKAIGIIIAVSTMWTLFGGYVITILKNLSAHGIGE
jgi:Fe2+ transport system protein B